MTVFSKNTNFQLKTHLFQLKIAYWGRWRETFHLMNFGSFFADKKAKQGGPLVQNISFNRYKWSNLYSQDAMQKNRLINGWSKRILIEIFLCIEIIFYRTVHLTTWVNLIGPPESKVLSLAPFSMAILQHNFLVEYWQKNLVENGFLHLALSSLLFLHCWLLWHQKLE